MVEFVRNGQKVWPTCPECGCRLEMDGDTTEPDSEIIVYHYQYHPDRDARGHKCNLLSDYWLWTNDLKITGV